MGREYVFYPAFQDAETKKIKPLFFDEEGKPESVYWRSGSFINGNFFTENFPMTVREDYEEKYQEYFCDGYTCLSEDAPTYVYKITEEELNHIGKSHGLISGYALLDEMEIYYASDCPQEYLYWNMTKPIPAEMYAELPKSKQNKYGRFAVIDTYSNEYICDILAEVLNDIITPYNWKGEKIMLMLYSF